MKRIDFLNEVAKYAIQDYSRSKVLPSLTISQAILESGWGNSSLAKVSKNLFGIKAFSSWKGAKRAYPTKEFYNGKWVTIDAYFREYPTFEGSVKDHNDLLQNKRYAKVLTSKDYKEAATEVWKAGYATDPNYPALLIRIIEQFKLYEHDNKALIKPAQPQIKKQEDDDDMKLSDSQWKQLQAQFEKYEQQGILNSKDWSQKAKNKTLTVSELAFLNTVLLDRK